MGNTAILDGQTFGNLKARVHYPKPYMHTPIAQHSRQPFATQTISCRQSSCLSNIRQPSVDTDTLDVNIFTINCVHGQQYRGYYRFVCEGDEAKSTMS